MKRFIVLSIMLLAIISKVSGIWLEQQIDQGILFSDQYLSERHCLQFILLIPAFMIGGLALILFPDAVETWLQEIIPWDRKKFAKSSHIFSIRLWGLILLVPIPFAFWPCGMAFSEIFGK